MPHSKLLQPLLLQLQALPCFGELGLEKIVGCVGERAAIPRILIDEQ